MNTTGHFDNCFATFHFLSFETFLDDFALLLINSNLPNQIPLRELQIILCWRMEPSFEDLFKDINFP